MDSNTRVDDELKAFRKSLGYLIIDIEGPMTSSLAWYYFIGLAVFIPLATCALKQYASLLRVEEISVQVGLTAAVVPAFWSIRKLLCRQGLNKAIFLDELRRESFKVQAQLVERIRLEYKLFYILIATFTILDLAYKLYWFFWVLQDSDHDSEHWLMWLYINFTWLCLSFTELISFMYRIAVVFVCASLLHTHCVLQGLRIEDFMDMFLEDVNLMSVYMRHKCMENHLRAISKAHEFFILSLVVIATGGQIWSAILVIRPNTRENLSIIIEPLLCMMFLGGSLLTCLTSAIQMTNRIQGIKAHVLSWHAKVSLTTDPNWSSNPPEGKSVVETDAKSVNSDAVQLQGSGHMMQVTEKFLSAKMIYDKRIAILTYIQAYKGGITLYGFLLDRNWLQALCLFQYTLTSWVLGKTTFSS